MILDLEKPKFIVQDGMLRMGRVVNHSDLMNENGGEVVGGGWWEFDREENILYLYSESIEFGQIKDVSVFENIYVQPSMENTKIFFSTEMSLNGAKENNILIQDINEKELL